MVIVLCLSVLNVGAPDNKEHICVVKLDYKRKKKTREQDHL